MKFATFAPLVALIASPSVSQTERTDELKIAVPARVPATAKQRTVVYYLVGEVGAHETYSVATKGPALLTVFGPDGSELLSASGSGAVRLDVVLPFTDVYTVAVAQPGPSFAYTLSRKATLPTLAEAYNASGVGYHSKVIGASLCWLVPGVKSRLNHAKGFEEWTLAADRATRSFVGYEAGKVVLTGERTYFVKDGDFQSRAVYSNGKVRERTFEPPRAYSPQSFVFVGYECGAPHSTASTVAR